MFFIILIGFIAWLVVPVILDFMGFKQKNNLNVIESYCTLAMKRRYKSTLE